MIEHGLNTYLRAHVPTVANRVYPISAPQHIDTPYLTYRRISTPQDYAHDGPTGLHRPRFQIDGYADTFTGIRDIATEVRAALSGYVGLMGTVPIQACKVIYEMDVYEPDPGVYRTIIDVVIWYQY